MSYYLADGTAISVAPTDHCKHCDQTIDAHDRQYVLGFGYPKAFACRDQSSNLFTLPGDVLCVMDARKTGGPTRE